MIHPTAVVDPRARLGSRVQIWHHAQVREEAQIGDDTSLGGGAYVDAGVRIGSTCKIQNGALIYHGATLESEVFVGPLVCILNDLHPRATTLDGRRRMPADWELGPVLIRRGASLGGGAVILPNVTVGQFALVGAGTMVTRDVPDHGLVVGNPARLIGYVCRCGRRLHEGAQPDAPDVWSCEVDGLQYRLGQDGLVASSP
jgi:acetyltransferase-like isoleucine patch superfamily enzyme